MSNSKQPKVPSYRHHKPSGLAVVTLDGRDHYLGKHGSPESRARYDRLIAEYLASGRRLPGKSLASRYTVGELCEDFLGHAERTYLLKDGSQSREVENVRTALKPLVSLFLDVQAEEFGPKSLILYRDGLVASGLARRTVNQRTSIVRRAFRWATQEERVSPSVLHGLEAVEGLKKGRSGARETDPVQPVPDEDIEAVLPGLPPPVRAMVELQLLTAARPGEVVKMRPCDIDMSGEVWLYRPPEHKNSWREQERVIPIGPNGQAIIHEFLRPGYQERFLFSPTIAEIRRRERARAARKTPLWPSHVRAQKLKRKARPKRAPRDHYDTVTYARAIRRACKRAKVPVWSPGRLRHNAATRARIQFGLEYASALLGHRQVETTQIYSDINQARAIEVAARVG